MSEITLESLATEVRALTAEIHQLQRAASSRRGIDGGRGPQGVPGKDAVIKIIQADGKAQILDPEGKVQAELVAVPGPAGKDGPSLDDLLSAFITYFRSRLLAK